MHNTFKPSKSMGTQEDCMGIGNIYMLTLKRNGGMGIPKGLCSREGVPSLCYVSGYCGAEACSQVSYLCSS